MISGGALPLLCPVDALPLTREPRPAPGSAIHRCGRHEYPEVSGIPVLLDSAAARAALDALRRGDAALARAFLLAPDRPGLAEMVARGADRLLGGDAFSRRRRSRRTAAFRRRHGDAPWRTFRDALAALLLEPPSPQPESYHYFLNRPADPTFLVAEAVVSAIPREARVLDLCCGAGHVTRLLARGRPGRVAGLDENFWLLHLASSYLAPEARLVCARADRPLPFAAGAFDAVVCSDALHDTAEPALLARESLRVLAQGGTAFMAHVHNPAFEHPYPGRNPLTPEGYASIFAAGDPRLLDERPILDRWLALREVDLAASHSASAISGARTIAILAGSRAPDRLHRVEPPAPDRVALNPMYRAAPDGEGLRLSRRWPSPLWLREYPEAALYLPEEARLGGAAIESLRRGRLEGEAAGDALRRAAVEGEAADLLRRRVLLDLPPAYGADTPW